MGRIAVTFALLATFFAPSAPVLAAPTSEHVLRVGLERGLLYKFPSVIRDYTSMDSRGIVEFRPVTGGDGSTLFIIGRKLGSAQVFVKTDGVGYESYVIHVLPADSDLSEPDYSIAMGEGFRLHVEGLIKSWQIVPISTPVKISISAIDTSTIQVFGEQAGRITLHLVTDRGAHDYGVEVYEP